MLLRGTVCSADTTPSTSWLKYPAAGRPPALVGTGRLRDVAVDAHRGAAALDVGALARLVVGLAAVEDGVLRDAVVAHVAHPRDDGRLLQRLAVGEGHVPGPGLSQVREPRGTEPNELFRSEFGQNSWNPKKTTKRHFFGVAADPKDTTGPVRILSKFKNFR